MTVTLETRADLTLAATARVAWQGEAVAISERALGRMAECKSAFLRLLDDPDIVIYGVTSGYGQHAGRRLDADQRKAHAARPLGAAASSHGKPLPERVARAIAFARLANFLEGHAAISPHVAAAVAGLLDGGPLPPVPLWGNGGAGEIQALTHLLGPMAAGLELVQKDGLALVNGSPCAAALVADAALAGRRRLALAEEVFALSAEAIMMPLEHLDPALEALWGDDHEAAALSRLRRLMAGGAEPRRPYQAPVSYRILPRMLGRLGRAVAAAEQAAATSLAAVSDNPVYLPPDDAHPNGRAISTGGYHNTLAWPAMDELAAACADLCTIADRHGAKLLTGAVSLLPDHLGDPTTDAVYLGCVPMAQVGWGEAARHAAQRSFLAGSESGGFGQNDVAPPNFAAWGHQEEAGRLLDLALGGLALIAKRALDITARAVPPALASLAALVGDTTAGVPGPEVGRIAAALGQRIYPAGEGASDDRTPDDRATART